MAPLLRVGGREREMAVSLKSWPRWDRSRLQHPLGVAAVKEVYQRGGLSGCRAFRNTEESGWDLVGGTHCLRPLLEVFSLMRES